MTRKRWSGSARRVGIVSSFGIGAVGLLYVGVILVWLVVEATPREPIGDPYLAVMEMLTIASGLALIGFVLAIRCFANTDHQIAALATLTLGSLGSVITIAVHFVQLTAVRQMWRAGQLADYRLVWPSVVFSVEYFAWDILLGLSLVCAGISLAGEDAGGYARGALVLSGILCVAGSLGPFTGRMALQNVAVLGYAIGLPIASVLTAHLFRATPRYQNTAA